MAAESASTTVPLLHKSLSAQSSCVCPYPGLIAVIICGRILSFDHSMYVVLSESVYHEERFSDSVSYFACLLLVQYFINSWNQVGVSH